MEKGGCEGGCEGGCAGGDTPAKSFTHPRASHSAAASASKASHPPSPPPPSQASRFCPPFWTALWAQRTFTLRLTLSAACDPPFRPVSVQQAGRGEGGGQKSGGEGGGEVRVAGGAEARPGAAAAWLASAMTPRKVCWRAFCRRALLALSANEGGAC